MALVDEHEDVALRPEVREVRLEVLGDLEHHLLRRSLALLVILGLRTCAGYSELVDEGGDEPRVGAVELGEQVVLMSPKAFEKIKYIEYEIVDGSIYNLRRMERENRAKRAYLDNHGADFEISKNDLFVRDILSEKVKNNDPRL